MTMPLLQTAFRHHVWATLRLIDACAGLDPRQLDSSADGTFGSIIETLRHLVGADVSYLFALSGGRTQPADADAMDLATLRATMERNGEAWSALLAEDPDPDAVVVRHRDDGSESHAPVGVRIAQALHHGSDHRSQVCTVLTTMGIEPPPIDVWDFADDHGMLREVAPPGS
jgi:uncharacterized damage-inducible protein DinB